MSTTGDSNKVVLYSYWRSSSSYRVRIALAFKGISYEYKGINLLKNEQQSKEFTSINPTQGLPVLVLPDGTVFTQSLAIMEYLEEAHPNPPMLPKDHALRAKVRALTEIVAADIQPIQNLRVLGHPLIGAENKITWAKTWINKGFEAIEKHLQTTAGKYCFGDTVTMADMCLLPQVFNANRFGVDMTKFPTISRINDALLQLDSFKKAHPDAMPDAVLS